MPWKLKLTEDGTAEVRDGLPVFVDDEGKETTIDPNQMHAKILQVNAESKSRRERLQELESRLSAVKDIDDLPGFIQQATKAMDLTKNLDDAKLVQAGEVEKIKAEAIQNLERQENSLKEKFQSREQELQTELQKRDGTIRQLLISGEFAKHELFAGAERKTHLPPDFAEAKFGSHFDVVERNGRPAVVGKDANGEVILSRDPKRFGEPADFHEAMDIIFNQYPQKDQLLRAGPGGSGAGGGTTGPGKPNPLAKLRKQYDEAIKAGNGELAATLKTRIFEAQRQGG